MADSFTGGGGTRYNTTPRRRTTTSTRRAPAAPAPQYSGGWGDALRRQGLANSLERSNIEVNQANLDAYDQEFLRGTTPGSQAPRTTPRLSSAGGGSARRGGGGGGGGGMSPEQLSWAMALAAGLRNQPTLDLPDYVPPQQRAFDETMWTQMMADLEAAYNTDLGRAQTAANNATNYVTQNYRNAFAAGPQATRATAPGMSGGDLGALARYQGVDPSLAAAEQAQMAGADQAFSNVWQLLGANEDRYQADRLRNIQTGLADTQANLGIAAQQGRTGVNMQRGRAYQSWQERADEWARQDALTTAQIAQQEATANWQAQQTGRTSAIEALLALLPSLAGSGVSLPDLAALGLA